MASSFKPHLRSDLSFLGLVRSSFPGSILGEIDVDGADIPDANYGDDDDDDGEQFDEKDDYVHTFTAHKESCACFRTARTRHHSSCKYRNWEDKLEYFLLDEADQMLVVGFKVMHTLIINDKFLMHKVLNSNGVVLVEFSAPWYLFSVQTLLAADS